jgi:hypothetical protein
MYVPFRALVYVLYSSERNPACEFCENVVFLVKLFVEEDAIAIGTDYYVTRSDKESC